MFPLTYLCEANVGRINGQGYDENHISKFLNMFLHIKQENVRFYIKISNLQQVSFILNHQFIGGKFVLGCNSQIKGKKKKPGKMGF